MPVPAHAACVSVMYGCACGTCTCTCTYPHLTCPQAYDVLIDASARRTYDAQQRTRARGVGAGFRGFRGFGGYSDDDDLFDSFYHGRARAYGRG